MREDERILFIRVLLQYFLLDEAKRRRITQKLLEQKPDPTPAPALTMNRDSSPTSVRARAAMKIEGIGKISVGNKDSCHVRFGEYEIGTLSEIEAAFASWNREMRALDRFDLLRAFCQHYGIELTKKRIDQIETWGPKQLGKLLLQISDSHEWPRD